VGDTRTIAAKPKHPYTRSLMSNVLTLRRARPQRAILSEHRPAPTGCRYRIVCPYVFAKCAEVPPTVDLGGGHSVSCFLVFT
jgi:oligopeptide/dipeptide ABC transporter ATP-binding protein